ncbi:hypothetical protein J6590_070639 [Homalodisca vitripennis]|nr:hypothetical protein J6590_070639 [Homalodisca vitripennis]
MSGVGWATLQAEWSLDLWLLKFTPWRLFYLLCGLPSLMGAVLFWITPESPKFLLSRGKKGDTLKVMQSVHSINSGANPQTYPPRVASIVSPAVSPLASTCMSAPNMSLGVTQSLGDQLFVTNCDPPTRASEADFNMQCGLPSNLRGLCRCKELVGSLKVTTEVVEAKIKSLTKMKNY